LFHSSAEKTDNPVSRTDKKGKKENITGLQTDFLFKSSLLVAFLVKVMLQA